MEIEFKDMEYMCALAKHRSITKAAQALFIAQPTLSQYLKGLQQRLGVPLFYIQGRTVRLTAEGELFVQEGERMLRERERTLSALSSIGQTGSGVLRLAVPLGRGSHILPEFIPEFHRRYPMAEIAVSEGHSRDLVHQVQNGLCDLVIINKPGFPMSIEYETLGFERLLLVVPADSPWAQAVSCGQDGRFSICLKQCRDAPFILHNPSQHTGLVERKIFLHAGIKPRVRLITENLEASYRLATCGYGLTFLSEHLISHWMTAGEAYHCELDDPLSDMEIIIGYRRKSELPFLAKEFIELVRQSIRQGRDGKGEA